MKYPLCPHSSRRGYTLIELVVVVVVIGVISMFAVPRYRQSVERAVASEAFTYAKQVQTAQEAYHALNGRYADLVDDLDLDMPTPLYFSLRGPISSNFDERWRLTLVRRGSARGYGQYRVVWTQEGFQENDSTIHPVLVPRLQKSSFRR